MAGEARAFAVLAGHVCGLGGDVLDGAEGARAADVVARFRRIRALRALRLSAEDAARASELAHAFRLRGAA